MLFLDVIKNLGKPFANGIEREVFYSKKYNVVIKRDMEEGCNTYGDTVYHEDDSSEQTLREVEIFNDMTAEEKEVFPIINTVMYEGKYYIVMKKCEALLEKFSEIPYHYGYDELCDRLGLSKENNAILREMIDKYYIDDLHYNNLGVDDKNRLVILDAGL